MVLLCLGACFRSGFGRFELGDAGGLDGGSVDASGLDAGGTEGGADAAQGDGGARPELIVEPLTIDEGQSGQVVVRLSRAASGPVDFEWYLVSLSAKGGLDFQHIEGAASLNSGVTSLALSVTTLADDLPEQDELLLLALTNATGASLGVQSQALITIRDMTGTPLGGAVVKVVSGGFSTCALFSDSGITCWGMDSHGQLGQVGAHLGDAPGEMGDALPAVPLGSGFVTEHLAMGRGHVCAVSIAGDLKCWGENYHGGLGIPSATRGDALGEMGDSLPTVDLAGAHVSFAVAGSYRTCVLLDSGAVKCWGRNNSGQLGLGDTRDRGLDSADMGAGLAAVDLGSARTVRQLSAGVEHTCALLDDFSVKCWGNNAHGALGLGDTEHRGDAPGEMGDNLPAVDLGTGLHARAVRAGSFFTCALLNDGRVKCWGNNNRGQLGVGDAENRGDQAGEMGDALPAVDLGTGLSTVAIGVGASHACALLEDLSLKCWGYNGDGQLGLGDDRNRGYQAGELGAALPAVDLGSGRSATHLFLGGNNSCVRRDDSSFVCWGQGSNGALGSEGVAAVGDQPGEMGDALVPLNLSSSSAIRELATASYPVGGDGRFNCALLEDLQVKCWGINGPWLGQGGLHTGDEPGEMGAALARVELGAAVRAVDLSGGGRHFCALLSDGGVKCWGYNNAILGLGDVQDRGDNPGEMGAALPEVDLGSGLQAIAVHAVGNRASCAQLQDFSLKCWGAGYNGVLGLGHELAVGANPGEMGDALPRIDLGSGRRLMKLAAGGSHACALLDDRSVRCWGWNAFGQLGLGHSDDVGGSPGDMGDNLSPVDLGFVPFPIDVVAAGNDSCALFPTGQVKCWGQATTRGDAPGEMGDALPYLDIEPVTQLVAGPDASHLCALLRDGRLKCFGANYTGQLGAGNTVSVPSDGDLRSLAAVDLGAGRSAVQVSCGANFTCALLDDSSVKCWGSGSFGSLGYGDAQNRGDEPGEMGDALPAVDLGL